MKILLVQVCMYERCITSKDNWGRNLHTENQDGIEYMRCIGTGLWTHILVLAANFRLSLRLKSWISKDLQNIDYTAYLYKVLSPTSRTHSTRHTESWRLMATKSGGKELRTRPPTLAHKWKKVLSALTLVQTVVSKRHERLTSFTGNKI
jgi:hypothetical protein